LFVTNQQNNDKFPTTISEYTLQTSDNIAHFSKEKRAAKF